VERNAMWLFSALFFGSLPVAAIMLIVSVFGPTSGTAKASGLFAILTITGLLGMVGLNILARFAVFKERDTQGPIAP
jgi:hypothetical protein